ncbi:MAG: hypothetical protein ACK452_01360, partial [Bacteroidota bacterium]
MKDSILYVFTKCFPYGNHEQYLNAELEILSRNFENVILVPTEYFDSDFTISKILPRNFSVFNINNDSANFKVKNRSKFEFLKILLLEFIFESDKLRFIKEFQRYYSILSYQFVLANRFSYQIHKNENQNKKVFLYSYWLHNSAVMLGLLRKRKVISNFISRAHSIDLFHNDWPFAYSKDVKVLPFQYFKTKMATEIHAVSDYGTRYLKNKYPRFNGKFFTSKLGIHDNGVGKFDQKEVFTMVSCSSVSENKRVTEIARLFSLLDFPANWIHFGEGEKMDEVKNIVSNLPSYLNAKLCGYTQNEK